MLGPGEADRRPVHPQAGDGAGQPGQRGGVRVAASQVRDRVEQLERSPPVGGDEGPVAGAGPGCGPASGQRSGCPPERRGELALDSGRVGRGASGQPDHHDQRGVVAARAEFGDDRRVGLVGGLAGQVEGDGEPVAGLGGGHAAGQGQHDPGCDYDPSVGERPPGQPGHAVYRASVRPGKSLIR